MCLDPILDKQRGAGLPVAIFVITVLALLVAGMAQLQESGAQSVSLQIQSQRAFYAAESGAQVAAADALYNSVCDAGPKSLDYTEAGLISCSADLSCSVEEVDINGDGNDESVYTIKSVGQCGSGAALRTVEVRVR